MDPWRDRSLLAQTYLAPWTALVRRDGPRRERLMEAGLSSLLWCMLLAVAALAALLVVFLADAVGRPVERVEGVVVSRTWRPATDAVAVAPVVLANGQVGTALTPDREPERYEVCFQVGDRQACAPVRPSRQISVFQRFRAQVSS